MSVVGFDFGNSSCVIGVAQKGGIDVILNDVSSRQTPCMAAFGEKERYLGDAASTQYLRNIKNTITNVKRLLGRKFDDPEVQQELKSCPFKAVKLPDETVGVEVMYCNEKKVFSVTAVAGMIMQKLKQTTENATGFAMRDVAIGVPGWWTDRQRRAMIDAAVIAGLNPLRLINEITATALAWGIYKTTLSDTEPTYVLFYDMGESQTSAAVVEFLKGKLKILSSSYDRNLGGRNFDELLVEHFCKEFKEKYKLDIKSNQKALIRLQIACEKLKKMLNTNPEAPINVDSIMNDIDVKGLMKRADFEAIIQPLLERAVEPARRALADSGIALEKISAIEISGGSTRLIPVQNKMTEVFKKDLSKTQNFEETVARGAALQCAMLSPVFRVREFSITDINAYPIKFSWKNISADPMQVDNKDSAEIFAKNSVVPSTKMITLHRNEGVELRCEYSDASSLPTGIDTFIGKFVIPSLPVNKKEEPLKIRVKVKLNIHSIIEVESAEVVETVEEAPATPTTPTENTTSAPAEPATTEPTPMQTEDKPAEPKADANANNADKKEEEKKKVKVNRINVNVNSHTASLVQKELQDLIDEEARMVASDRLAFETAEKKNAVESYIYEMRDKLSASLSDFATQTEKDSLLKIFDATQDWLYGEGEDATKSVYVKKLDEMKVIGDPVTKRAFEYENRIDSVSQLRKTLEQFKLTATLEDPKYEHISNEEKQKIVTECNNIATWLNEKVAQQDKLPKHADPVFTVQELNKKKDEVSKFCNAILSKPKPKPEPKKEEPKKEEPKKEEEKKTDAKPESAPEQKNEMDLD